MGAPHKALPSSFEQVLNNVAHRKNHFESIQKSPLKTPWLSEIAMETLHSYSTRVLKNSLEQSLFLPSCTLADSSRSHALKC